MNQRIKWICRWCFGALNLGLKAAACSQGDASDEVQISEMKTAASLVSIYIKFLNIKLLPLVFQTNLSSLFHGLIGDGGGVN